MLPAAGKPVDFSVNVSPLGMPKAAVRAVRRSAVSCAAYPDPFCKRLRAAISARVSVPAEHIVCGAGAADLIYRIVRWKRPDTALVTAPAFSDYEKALVEGGCRVTRYPLAKDGFAVDERLLSAINGGLVFICNPNNPTGRTVERTLLERIVGRCADTNATLVIDECFNGFLDDPNAHSALPFLGAHANLIVLRAFTKIYAMAGLRLGYCVTGTEEAARALALTGQPWPVSAVAQSAGIAALSDRGYTERLRRLVSAERARLKAGLGRLGISVLGGEANFVFFRVPEGGPFDAETFFADLLRRNILLRRCDNYHGLDGSYYRCAVLTPRLNKRLLRALENIKATPASGFLHCL
jgi:threonine-phosphate decarboxylase